ncbi:MAG TPA: dienelactone hydrolase family protein, partial [Micromonosporaceae bacterium]
MTAQFGGFELRQESHGGVTRDVYQGGSGPAIIVIHEIPGLHPGVVDFARKVVAAGFTAVMPSLFGTPGRKVSGGYAMSTFLRACVAAEFTGFALGKTSPIVGWLRDVAARAHEDCGGPGVGAVGMCFTGNFALAMSVDDRMLAPVMSQPAMPMAMGAARKASVGISDADLSRVKARAADGLCVMGLRFTNDSAVPSQRFATLRDALGDNFIAVEID